ncbi:MAG: segregation/condensation protein A [Oligoflexia bacterium]|nr:segregation/condensation protein A [Oligoflexia bacterium]
MLENDIQVKTTYYDGPLGLLLHLIQKEEMDIKKLNIAVITEQYLEYLSQMRELNFDHAGDYLYMASTLLLLKSRACIDDDDNVRELLTDESGGAAITSRTELIRRLEELDRFQKLGKALWSRTKLGHETFVRTRGGRKALLNTILTAMDLNELILCMANIVGREKSKITYKRDPYSVKDKILFLRRFLVPGNTYSFRDIVEKDENSSRFGLQHLVVAFSAILELARLKKVLVFQDEHIQEIYVEVIASLQDFDINLVDSYAESSANESLAIPSEVQ